MLNKSLGSASIPHRMWIRFLPVMKSSLPRLPAAVLLGVAALLAVPDPAAQADDQRPGAKVAPKPVKLAVAQTRPEVAGAPGLDPGFDTDPNLPAYLRPVRLFSRDGRFLDARLLSISGNTVTVERISDARRFDISLETLDEASNRRVQVWMEQDPDAVDFSIGLSAKKRQVESDSFESMGRVMKTSQWVYDVVVTNQSRNELHDAQVEYRIVFNDEVEFVKTAVYPGKGGNQQDGQSVDLPVLAYNGRAEFSTAPLDMNTFEYEPLRGEKEFFRDQVVGIWVRVLRQGKVIAEYQSNAASMHNLVWDGDEETEITVRDSFRDQFTSKKVGE